MDEDYYSSYSRMRNRSGRRPFSPSLMEPSQGNAYNVCLGLLTFTVVSLIAVGVAALTFSIQSRNTLGDLRTEIDTLTSWVEGNATLVGEIKLWGNSTIPQGWLLCDGSEYLISEYSDLHALLGETFNTVAVSSALYFRVPDLRGRSVVGAGNGTYTYDGIVHDVDTPFEYPKVLGEMAGAEYSTGYAGTTDDALLDEPTSAVIFGTASVVYTATDTGDTIMNANEGGGNYSPYTVLNFIIKY